MIEEIAGQPAYDRLVATLDALPAEDRQLAQRGLHLGTVIDEHKIDFERGDFLIRNLMGADRGSGAIAVSDFVDVGATVQFQVRDANAVDDDLRALLTGRSADGALIFTCNGRGTNLFDEPNHDATVVADYLDHPPAAGMFCAGEVGPVGGRPFLHGFTASIALFRDL